MKLEGTLREVIALQQMDLAFRLFLNRPDFCEN